MTPVDDLEVGMWVAVVDCEDEPQQVDFNPFHMFEQRRSRPQFSGLPLRVLAISLPFVCVSVDGSPQSLDIRRIRLQRVSKEYCEAMMGKSALLSRGKCPECGTSLSEGPDGVLMYWIGGTPSYCRKCKKKVDALSVEEAPPEDG